MGKNIGFIKKMRLFSSYKKSLKSVERQLVQNFGIRIDSAQRMYTVLNIPEELIGEAFSMKKSDIERVSENYVKEYIAELNRFLSQNGMSELLEVYEIKKVDKYSFLVVVGFSLFKSNEFYNKLYFRYIPITAAVLIAAIIFLAL